MGWPLSDTSCYKCKWYNCLIVGVDKKLATDSMPKKTCIAPKMLKDHIYAESLHGWPFTLSSVTCKTHQAEHIHRLPTLFRTFTHKSRFHQVDE